MILLWVSALVIICLWVGFRKRKEVEPPIVSTTIGEHEVRVLLFDKIRKCMLDTNGSWTATDMDTGNTASFDTKKVLAVTLFGKLAIGEHILAKHVEIATTPPGLLSIDGKQYRGKLTLIIRDDEETMTVINTLHMEEYLAGVIGAEMPSYWESQALKAQTIASRTYCLHIQKRFGQKRRWDVKSTEANQVYRGIAAETATIRNAVRQTAGLVLVCEHPDGSEGIFPTYFSSTCGGHTENSKAVFGDSWQPLKGVPCPYCKEVAKEAFYFWDTVEFDAKDVSRRLIAKYPLLERLESIEQIEPLNVSTFEDFKRTTRFKLVGKGGKSHTLEAENLRLTIDPSGRKIKSASFVLTKQDGRFRFSNGRGFGHCVGMCQYGAQGLARKKADYDRILAHYYPTASIKKIY